MKVQQVWQSAKPVAIVIDVSRTRAKMDLCIFTPNRRGGTPRPPSGGRSIGITAH
jgi:hypothetical protein